MFSIQSYSQSSTKLITYNIRYANNHDGDDSWDNRKAKVVDILKTNNPDIIGLQEVLKKQLNYLDKNLDQYDYVGVGRDNGKTKGEYSPIFYKKINIRWLIKVGFGFLKHQIC
jgi:endonuclease/exonuclease/phosphatase family metal-dependent hydrolase